MDVLPLLIAMVVGLCVLGAVFGILAYAHSSRLARRLDRLEQSLRVEHAPRPGPTERVPAASTPPAVAPVVAPTRPPPVPEWTEPAPAPVFARPARPAPPPPRPSEPAPAGQASTQPVEPAVSPAGAERPAGTEPVPVGGSSTASAPKPRVELERWLGVRGAAVLGGIVLAIAGFLFLQYSIERQLITPQTRVIVGACVGILCLGMAMPLRKRGYVLVANSISGAGAVLLYAAAWAAHVLYGMIEFPAAFAAMVAVTAACAWLARRHGSLVIAVLGLVGGLATPIALASGQDRPIALFGYVLLVDLAFLFVAQKRRWPSLGLVALLGTFVMQGLWIFERMDRASLAIGLVVLAVFALLFALFASRLATADRRRWVVSQAGALLLPFVFALYFAQEHALGEDLWPLAALAAVLALAAGWMGRSSEMAWLPIGSAAGVVALAFTWTMSREVDLTRPQVVELVGCSLILALIHAVFTELASRMRAPGDVLSGARGAALVAAFGFQGIALFTASRSLDPEPWILVAASTVLALFVARAVALGGAGVSFLAACGAAGATVLTWALAHRYATVEPAPGVWCATIVLAGGALLLAAWLVRVRQLRFAFWGVPAFVVPALAAHVVLGNDMRHLAGLYLGAALVLGIQIALAATSARSSAMFAVAILAAWLGLILRSNVETIARTQEFVPVFACWTGALVVFTLWPVAKPACWMERSNAWRAAALVPVLWFLPIHDLFVARWSRPPVFTLPIGFELVAGAAALRLAAARASEDRSRRVGRIWFACTAIFFAALIVPLQIDRETLAITLAWFALGLALLRLRIDARALPWVAMSALAASAVLLVGFRPLEPYTHSDVRVWNWLAYEYLLPAAAAVATTALLRRRTDGVAVTVTGLSAVVFVFAWINLEIANAFTTQERFVPRFEHVPARDLTVSIAWASYAIVLLVLGMSKQRGGLRWASLVLLMLTIGKVFLLDLGSLGGLYRAASVFGLGVSLLLVSVLYQRFVFRRPKAAT